ncbi:glycoside hydrolase [Chaetomium sp. MPI-SDFR-AT-0129]|nr:glycoside hydrolase [Chaetomium sp. MPI-SDFR-AT-0129]
MMHKSATLGLLAAAGSAFAALQVDISSTSSIKAAAKDVAFDVMSVYKGNQSGEVYYWWTGAVLWSTMIDYWHYTNDSTYNAVTVQGLTAQNGPNLQSPFMPPNWTASMGNDDQGFWGIAAAKANEAGLPAPPKGEPSWLDLAKAVFQVQTVRYTDSEDACGGGLRWMIVPVNTGFDLKNTASTAVFLNLGARLYHATQNETYADWVEKGWTWLTKVGLVDDKFNVYDSINADKNCTDIAPAQWSHNAGLLLETAAYMYTQESSAGSARSDKATAWKTRTISLANRTVSHFFSAAHHGILVEPFCEGTGPNSCSREMSFYKGIALRSLTGAAELVDELRDPDHGVGQALRATAQAAVQSCSYGTGRECGFRWASEPADQSMWLYEAPLELNALSAVLGPLVVKSASGTSGNGNGAGGSGGNGDSGDAGSGGNGQGGDGDGSAGASLRVGMGVMVAGLVAALI